MKTNIVIDISPPIPYLENSSSPVLSFKMMSANQITGFFKMYYLKKEVNDEAYFWHTDKHRSFFQADTIILGVCSQVCPKYPK